MRPSFLALICVLSLISLSVAVWPFKGEDVSFVKYVHVVFSNHLDVGFDGIAPLIGMASTVGTRE